jgi:hypothetical protein
MPINLPVIGSRIKDGIVALGSHLAGAVRSWADPALHALAQFINPLNNVFHNIVGQAIDSIHGLYLYVVRLRLVIVPALIEAARQDVIGKIVQMGDYVRGVAAGVENWATGKLNALQAWAAGEIATARKYALGLVTAAVNYATDVLNQSLAWARAAESSAISWASAAVSDLDRKATTLYQQGLAATAAAERRLTGEIGRAVTDAEAYAKTAAAAASGAAVAGIDHAASAVLADVWPEISIDIGDILDQAGDEFADLRARLGSLTSEIPFGIAGLFAGTGALELLFTRYLRECGVRNCRNLGDLSDLLGGLTDAASLALLLELLREIVTNPDGAAKDLADTVGGLVGDGISLARTLIGV